MVDLIRMGYLSCEERDARITKWIILAHWDSNRVRSAHKGNSLSIVLLDQISIPHLKVDHILPKLEFTF